MMKQRYDLILRRVNDVAFDARRVELVKELRRQGMTLGQAHQVVCRLAVVEECPVCLQTDDLEKLRNSLVEYGILVDAI